MIKDGCVVNKNGTKLWYQNGQLHREDEPAIEYLNGDRCWYRNGKYHREDGPAIEYTDGRGGYWFLHGQHIDCSSQEEFERLLRLKVFW